MSAFELIELSFDPEEAKPTLEDEFTMTMVAKDLEKLDDPEHLQIASKQLLNSFFYLYQKLLANETHSHFYKSKTYFCF